MAIDYINGSDKPKFTALHPITNEIVEHIPFPLTNESGLIEDTDELKASHYLLFDDCIEEYVRGYRINWTLYYDQHIHKDTMKALEKVLKYRKDRYPILFTPRIDAQDRYFEVNYTGNFQFGIHKGGLNAPGNKGVVIQFTTKRKVADLNWIDPDDIQYNSFFPGLIT